MFANTRFTRHNASRTPLGVEHSWRLQKRQRCHRHSCVERCQSKGVRTGDVQRSRENSSQKRPSRRKARCESHRTSAPHRRSCAEWDVRFAERCRRITSEMLIFASWQTKCQTVQQLFFFFFFFYGRGVNAAVCFIYFLDSSECPGTPPGRNRGQSCHRVRRLRPGRVASASGTETRTHLHKLKWGKKSL